MYALHSPLVLGPPLPRRFSRTGVDALNGVSVCENDCLVSTLSTDWRQRDTKSGWVAYLSLHRVMQSLFMNEVACRDVVDAQSGPSGARECVET